MLLALAIYPLAMMASANDRSDSRHSTGSTLDVTDVLGVRGTFFSEWIGDDLVELSFVNDSLSLAINEEAVGDVDYWIETYPSEVVHFSAYNGDLLGWVYLDEFDEVLVELDAIDTYIIYQIAAGGAPVVTLAKICRCRKPGWPTAGCTTMTMCDNGDSCPGSSGHYCAKKYGSLVEFEDSFASVTN